MNPSISRFLPAGLFLVAQLLCLGVATAQTVSATLATGTDPRVVAVNPLTNRIYVANESSNNVTEIDGATNTMTDIAVGTRPQHIAVNPATNKVYVNGGDANVWVIDGATRATTQLAVGSTGPMAIHPVTNKIYIVRLSTPAFDEVTVLDGATNTWFSWATDSFQPNGISLDTLRNIVYVSHYATGSVAAIPGGSTVDFPHPPTVGVWTKPVALTVNPVTNKIYVIGEDPRGPINILDGADFRPGTGTSLTPAGHAVGPRAIAVNTATNKVYAAFNGEMIVIDGATNALTFIPLANGGPVAVAINAITNKIYAPLSGGGVAVIDGDTNTAVIVTTPAGALAAGVNPITNKAYAVGPVVSVIDGAAADTVHAVPLTTTIGELPGNSSGPTTSFTFTAASTFSPSPLPVRRVYWQIDSRTGAWNAAAGSGPFTANVGPLSPGEHTIHAFAVDSQDAPSTMTGIQSSPLIGNMASYTFTVVGTPRTVVDFDANGKGDLLWRHTDGRQAAWLMDGATRSGGAEILAAASGWTAVRMADFNDDGKSDIVWQHDDGRVAISFMNGTGASSTTQILNAGAWRAIHAPDLNGDGDADLVFRNTAGTVAVWTLVSGALTAGASIIGPGTGWSVVKTADFDGDGNDDLLWMHADGRHAIWLMDGVTVRTRVVILAGGGGWSGALTPDLDGDGKADIVWQNIDGRVAAWRMDGAMMASGASLLPAGSGWSVMHAGDFDSDGRADLLFGHTDGRAAIYLMNGTSPSAQAQILDAASGWSAVRVADLDGDGRSDIVWQHSDGSAAVWLMNATSMASGAGILAAGSGWSAVALDP